MAKLVFVSVAKLNPHCECCTKHRRGFYRAVWQFDGTTEPPTPERVQKLAKHPLFGVTVCVN